GGVIGDALLRVPASLMHAPLSGALRIAIAAATGMAMMVALALSMGMGWRDRVGSAARGEDDDTASDAGAEEGSFISLGRIHHGILSLRARLGRLFGTADRRPAAPGPKLRIEPTAATDDEAWEDEGEDEDEGPAPRARRRKASAARTGAKRSRSGFELPALSPRASRWCRAAMPSESNSPIHGARRSICASCSPARITPPAAPSCRSVSARPSAANR